MNKLVKSKIIEGHKREGRRRTKSVHKREERGRGGGAGEPVK